MHHIIAVGMNAETLRQLDELRELYPAASRGDVIKALIHAASLERARHAGAAPIDIDFAS
jgi:hypothetical protein